MNPQPVSPPNPASPAPAQNRPALEQTMRNGVSWFYWIAGLSLVNSVIFLVGGNLNFVVGLGLTQLVDGFMFGMARALEGSFIIRLIGFGIDLGIAGVFALFGFLGHKRFYWAVILGMILYAFDALIFLYFSEFLSVAFHAFALYNLWRGLSALNALRKMDEAQSVIT